jgi:spermidine/putrescine transport system substrate-binding protein
MMISLMKSLLRRISRSIAALLLTATPFLAHAEAPQPPDGNTLYLFNWSDYIPPSLLQEFEQKYHVKIVQSYYSSNSELRAKLTTGGDSQYDVVVPSGSYLANLVRTGLLQKLDKSEIPNAKNIAPFYQNQNYDPGNVYSLPYQTGTTGIVYTQGILTAPSDGWGILFDPKLNPSYPFALMGEDGRDIISAACAYLGYGFACTQEAQWLAAAKLIRETMKRPNFSGFYDGDPAWDAYSHELVKAAIVYNGPYVGCSQAGTCKQAVYVLPREGTELWVDTMAIPTHAPHPKLAAAFINFILEAQSGADLSNYNGYTSPNAASAPLLPPSLRPLDAASPASSRLVTLPVLTPAQEKLFNQIWTQVRK